MRHTHRTGHRFHRLSVALTGLIAIVALLAATGGEALAGRDVTGGGRAKSGGNRLYIVQMIDQPVVAYTGGIPGLRATRPNRGQKIDPNSPDVVRYAGYLDSKHDAKVGGVGGRKVYSYRYAFNGFAAELTAAQVAALRADPEVVAVTKDELAKLDTSTTPSFLGLNAPGGIWSRLSGNADGNPITANGPNSAGAGEGVVVGIIDSGIWPENPSFSDRDAQGKLVFQQLPGWHGKCVPGEAFTASNCNQKLISAQWFNAGFGGDGAIKGQFPYEFVSARAADGHGVHTASTAAGNYGVPVIVDGIDLGQISGMAPRARVAVYKTCWGISPEGGCFNSDNVAAIDQAVADGVDVLNFSISGTSTNFRDPVEIAFLFAADAGVFVAASAGNSGPGASTVAHPSPWITTVAASTHNREGQGSVTLGNGATYSGASLAAAAVTAPLIAASAGGLAGAPAAEVGLCYPGTLDPSLVGGKIVVCDRGVIGRTEKSSAVKQAGGVGMILVNPSPNSINADLHFVPTVHVDSNVRAAILAYAATLGATATINQASLVFNATAPTMASFSSRGPLRAGGGDLLKPDITAPGVDVLAAYSPVATGRDYEFLSGTSMSSPHLAGIGALMKDLYPTWSPAAIKSALMTTAYQTTRTGAAGQAFGAPFDYGAGHVDPNPAMNPGLVYNSGFSDWLAFICAAQPGGGCAGVTPADPSNLNMPSIAIGDLAGVQTVTRTVTNVSGGPLTVSASVSGLAGVTADVSPASLTLAKGESKSFTVTFTRATAELNAFTVGQLTWSGGGYSVRSPIVIRPVALAAPAGVTSTGAGTSYNVTFGYTGSFSAAARGLVPAAVTPGTVTQDPDQEFDPADPSGTVAIPVAIPAGTTYARFALFDADVAAGADMDLYVYLGSTMVGASTSGTSAEEVNFSFANPTGAAIPLTVYVHGWGVPGGSSPFKLHSWYVPATSAGNMTVSAPASATLGGSGTVSLSFSGLTPGVKYLGSVVYGGAASSTPPTIVVVNP